MPKKITVEFLNKVISNSKTQTYLHSYNMREIVGFVESLSDSKRKELLSDASWNKYPKYVSYRNFAQENPRCHAKSIDRMSQFVYSNRQKYPNTYKSILNHSAGIFLDYAMGNFGGSDRQKLARRGMTSSDARVRKGAARILPIHHLKKMINDSDYGVKRTVARRISPASRPDLFINCNNFHPRMEALLSSDIERNTIIQRLNELSTDKNWYATKEMSILLDKLSDDDILFFMNLSQGKNRSDIADYLAERLT
jgi:hypothetical protein